MLIPQTPTIDEVAPPAEEFCSRKFREGMRDAEYIVGVDPASAEGDRTVLTPAQEGQRVDSTPPAGSPSAEVARTPAKPRRASTGPERKKLQVPSDLAKTQMWKREEEALRRRRRPRKMNKRETETAGRFVALGRACLEYAQRLGIPMHEAVGVFLVSDRERPARGIGAEGLPEETEDVGRARVAAPANPGRRKRAPRPGQQQAWAEGPKEDAHDEAANGE